MSDEFAPEVVPYSAFLERRERRERLAEDLARRRVDAVIVDEPAVRAPQSSLAERARRCWLEQMAAGMMRSLSDQPLLERDVPSGAGNVWALEECGDRDPSGARVGALLQALIAREPGGDTAQRAVVLS